MVSERQALSAWQRSLEEDIGVDEAAVVVDRVGDVVTRRDLDRRLDRLSDEVDRKLESLGGRLTAAWRRDLLLIAVPQLMALTAILLGVGG